MWLDLFFPFIVEKTLHSNIVVEIVFFLSGEKSRFFFLLNSNVDLLCVTDLLSKMSIFSLINIFFCLCLLKTWDPEGQTVRGTL